MKSGYQRFGCYLGKKHMLKRKEQWTLSKKSRKGGFSGGAVVKNLSANAGDTGLSPGLGRSHMPRSD